MTCPLVRVGRTILDSLILSAVSCRIRGCKLRAEPAARKIERATPGRLPFGYRGECRFLALRCPVMKEQTRTAARGAAGVTPAPGVHTENMRSAYFRRV